MGGARRRTTLCRVARRTGAHVAVESWVAQVGPARRRRGAGAREAVDVGAAGVRAQEKVLEWKQRAAALDLSTTRALDAVAPELDLGLECTAECAPQARSSVHLAALLERSRFRLHTSRHHALSDGSQGRDRRRARSPLRISPWTRTNPETHLIPLLPVRRRRRRRTLGAAPAAADGEERLPGQNPRRSRFSSSCRPQPAARPSVHPPGRGRHSEAYGPRPPRSNRAQSLPRIHCARTGRSVAAASHTRVRLALRAPEPDPRRPHPRPRRWHRTRSPRTRSPSPRPRRPGVPGPARR
jgi:hypothetical protein